MVLINMLSHPLLSQYLGNIINYFIDIKNNSKKNNKNTKFCELLLN
jgi:hypothetical protein